MEIDARQYDDLLQSIRFIYGYDFTDYAEPSVKRRIVQFMESHEIETLDGLGKFILKDEARFESFVQHLSVTVTEMFRDPSFFLALRKTVMKRLATYPVVKVWIAGCATGEEVYSIAVLLKEEGLYERSIIYATDINQKSLRIAREGVYPLQHMQQYSRNYIQAGGKQSFSQYYLAQYGGAIFDKTLRENVVFSPHNLTVDQSFNEFQLVICRNVLMYFNTQLQARVIQLFCSSLCMFGFLGLGDKESLWFSDKKECFEKVNDKEKIYRRIR